MLRALPAIITVALLIFCLIDCAQTPPERVRTLPKWGWLVIIVIFPFAGSIAWLIAGRASAEPEPVRGGPIAPDDDPEFLRRLREQSDHSRRLETWEDDLKRREDELRDDRES